MVCIPSGATDVERSAVEEATLRSGAARSFLIEEPLAGAIGAKLPVTDPVGSAVVDIGGGTSEMAVTALGGIVVSKSIPVGGYDLDEAIVRLVQTEQQLLIGQEQAEALKIEIGTVFPASDSPAAADVAGRDRTSGLLRRATVTAKEIQRALHRPLERIVDAVKLLLEETPPDLSSDIAARGLMLIGGGALLRGLDQLLREQTGLAVTVAEEPLTTVARGAGLALDQSGRFAISDAKGRRSNR